MWPRFSIARHPPTAPSLENYNITAGHSASSAILPECRAGLFDHPSAPLQLIYLPLVTSLEARTGRGVFVPLPRSRARAAPAEAGRAVSRLLPLPSATLRRHIRLAGSSRGVWVVARVWSHQVAPGAHRTVRWLHALAPRLCDGDGLNRTQQINGDISSDHTRQIMSRCTVSDVTAMKVIKRHVSACRFLRVCPLSCCYLNAFFKFVILR